MQKSILSLLLIVCVASASAQKTPRGAEDERHDFETSINEEIDNFLEKVSRGIATGNINHVFSVDTIERKPRRSIRTAELETDAFAHSYSGDTIIDIDELVKGNVVVKGGDLKVHGTIEGDVLVVGGTLYVNEDGFVTGNARVINGTIVKEDGARIGGYEDAPSSTASYRTKRSGFRSFGTSFDVPWLNQQGDIDDLLLRYNRVEGIFVGLQSEKKYYWDGRRSWTAFGGLGWGFKSHTWRYNLGLARQFALSDNGTHLLELGVEGYSLTDSKDMWIISTNENSMAAFLIHEDFLDYYSRRGVTGHLAWYTQGNLLRTEIKLGYAADSYDSLSLKTDWALFGGDKAFRTNPAIQPQKIRTAIVTAGLSTFEKTVRGPEGWSLYLTSEFGRGMPGSDASFNRLVADLRRYQPIGRYDNLNIRLRVGTAEGILPSQKMFDLGGIGTLHAYRYKAFSGNRMILLNTEYILDGGFLDEIDFWPASIFSGLTFLFMSDAGVVRNASIGDSFQDGFEDVGLGNFAHNFGFGISNRSGSFRLAYTWRTDVKTTGVLIFRFVRPF
jgi:hypothetical protein